MSNRVYLCCTDFAAMPREIQWDEFLKVSGVEYEAKACIPIFWLCLFCDGNITLLASDHDGFDDDARSYAYLVSDKEDAIARIRLRSSMMARALGHDRATLFQEWIQRLEQEPYTHILVRTRELDWMCKEGELEQLLTKAFNHFRQVDAEEEIRMSNAIRDLAGLWNQEALHECESFELVGTAHGMDSWPPSLNPLPNAAPKPQERPWWSFWRN